MILPGNHLSADRIYASADDNGTQDVKRIDM
jgi:hypothetical protein